MRWESVPKVWRARDLERVKAPANMAADMDATAGQSQRSSGVNSKDYGPSCNRSSSSRSLSVQAKRKQALSDTAFVYVRLMAKRSS